MTENTKSFLQLVFDGAAVAAVYVVMIFLLLILMANWSMPYFNVMKPQLFLIAVFYWTLYRPRFLPPVVIFCGGLFLDLMNPAFPLGTQAFSYLLISGLLRPRRRMLMGQPFIAVWIWFTLAAVVDMGIKVLALMAVSPVVVNIWIILLSSFVTILSFPLLLMIFVMLQRVLPVSRMSVAT